MENQKVIRIMVAQDEFSDNPFDAWLESEYCVKFHTGWHDESWASKEGDFLYKHLKWAFFQHSLGRVWDNPYAGSRLGDFLKTHYVFYADVFGQHGARIKNVRQLTSWKDSPFEFDDDNMELYDYAFFFVEKDKRKLWGSISAIKSHIESACASFEHYANGSIFAVTIELNNGECHSMGGFIDIDSNDVQSALEEFGYDDVCECIIESAIDNYGQWQYLADIDCGCELEESNG